MRRLSSLVVVLALVPTFGMNPAFAQTPAQVIEFGKVQKTGVDAIGASKWDEAIAAFKRCLELVPKSAPSSYNLACIYSRKNELDPAFEWLGKAIDLDFAGMSAEELKMIETGDSDLVNVRKDPRFAPLVERLKARRKSVADFVAKPEIYLPAALKDAESVPLLVVLHDGGQTKTTALEKGPWKRIADELGVALLMPSAPCLVGGEPPAAGMHWFHSWFGYGDKPWIYEKTVTDAVDVFRKAHKLDPEKMFIAGQGEGGMVAFNVAICAPGSYKGVIVYASTIVGGTATAARAKSAASRGLKAKLLVPDSQLFSPNVDPAQLDAEFTSVEKLFKEWELAGGIERFQRKADDPDQPFNVIKGALKSFLQPEAPAPEPEKGDDDDKDDKDGKGGG